MIDEKKKLEVMRTSLEIIKKHSNDPFKKAVIDDLLNSDDKEKVSDELMMKLVHQTYNSYDKRKESKEST